jgi:Phage integrase, N-terminal SAM-like domain
MTDEAISPLRRRMIEDMTIRNFTPKTQHDYIRAVKTFAAFLGQSPDRACDDKALEAFQHSHVEQKLGQSAPTWPPRFPI